MSVKKVPTLTAAGFVDNIGPSLDSLISDSLIAKKSRSILFPGQVTSLQYLVAKHGHDPVQLCQETRTEYQRYLERYFDLADVEVTTNAETESRYTLTLNFSVVQNDVRYSVGREIAVLNSKTMMVIDHLNHGQ